MGLIREAGAAGESVWPWAGQGTSHGAWRELPAQHPLCAQLCHHKQSPSLSWAQAYLWPSPTSMAPVPSCPPPWPASVSAPKPCQEARRIPHAIQEELFPFPLFPFSFDFSKYLIYQESLHRIAQEAGCSPCLCRATGNGQEGGAPATCYLERMVLGRRGTSGREKTAVFGETGREPPTNCPPKVNNSKSIRVMWVANLSRSQKKMWKMPL